jgi:hypothetical protein
MIGMAVLLFSNFPPLGSTLIEKDDEEEEEEAGAAEDEPLLNDRD